MLRPLSALLVILALSPNANAQRPTAKVTSRVDVNADGRVDEIRIAEDGGITVLITGDESAGAWTPLAASGKVVGGSIVVDSELAKGRTIILATSKLGRRGGRHFTEAVALAWTPGKLETLWRGKLGSQGADGSSSLSVELGKFGLIKYASRTGVSRCDGETAHLDAQRYDFASGRFRPARQALRMQGADKRPTLVANVRPPSFLDAEAKAFWFRGASASSSRNATSAAELVPPVALADGDPATAWVENKGGIGAGEFVTLRSDIGVVNVSAIRFWLGHGGAQLDYGRPKRLGVILSASDKYWVDFAKGARGAQWVVLPKPVASQCVSLVLDSVEARHAKKPTAISEVTVFSEEEADGARAASLVAAYIATGKGGGDKWRLLQGLGTKAADALQNAIVERQADAGSKTRKEITNLRLALAHIRARPAELARGLADERLHTREHSLFSAALLDIGTGSISPLVQALSAKGITRPAAHRITNVLATLPQEAAGAALLELLGQGTASVRKASVTGLARRDDAWTLLPIALAQARTTSRKSDLYWVASMLGKSTPRGSEKLEALADALLTSAMPAPASYEEHYRLLQAAGALRSPRLTDYLNEQFAALSTREDAQGLALLRQTVSSLGQHKSPSAQTTVDRALEHTDPGVRLVALAALPAGQLAGARERLQSDSWPEVRQSAAATLAPQCTAMSNAALRRATLDDRNTKVASTAFAGLLHCGDSELFAISILLVDSDKRPLDLQLQAARVLGELATTPAQSSSVLSRFSKARRMALSSRRSGKLASALTRALADLGSPAALKALESSAADPAFPQLQAAAIAGLGRLCEPTSMPLLRRLQQSHEHSVALAATMATRRCQAESGI